MSVRRPLGVVAAIVIAMVTVAAVAVGAGATAHAEFEPLPTPQRLLDTRPAGTTVDGRFEGAGTFGARSVNEIGVAGRGGIAPGATATILNLTVIGPDAIGYVTVFPCDQPQPNAANVNYSSGQVIANAVFARLSADGAICVFTSARTHVVVDATGALPADSFVALDAPRRVLDTRPAGRTVDGVARSEGRYGRGETRPLLIAGRAGLPTDTSTAVLNLTAINPDAAGYVTVFPCGEPRPTAANLTHGAAQTIANSVVARIGASGAICIYTSTGTDLVVDATGSLPADSFTALAAPQRVIDTRDEGETADGLAARIGRRSADTTFTAGIGGRVGIPTEATAVVLNVTVVQPDERGYLTVHPGGTNRPIAANLNFDAGDVIANTVVARLGPSGTVCMFTSADVHLVADVTGFLAVAPAASPTTSCPQGSAPTPPPPPAPEPPEPPSPPSPPSPPPEPEPPPTPPGSIAPGQYRVWRDLLPGLYVMEDAAEGCYWERQSGLGGTLDEILANEYRGYPGRVIVQILPFDAGFDFDPGCGPMRLYRRARERATTIVPGSHVVGQHIRPGTYRTDADDGCTWERVSAWTGDSSQILEGAFVEDGGPQVVVIRNRDAGFTSSAECGIWTRTSGRSRPRPARPGRDDDADFAGMLVE